MDAIVSRSEAKASGSRHYFPGTPCKRAHVAARFTSTGQCTACMTERTKNQTASGFYKENYKKTRAARSEQSRQSYLLNREERIKKAAEWASENQDRRRAISMSYKARRRSQEAGGISTADLSAWLKKQKKTCHWCGRSCRERFHVDHVMPLSKGGKHERENLVIACPTCNLTKNATDPYVFAARIGRLLP